MNRVYRIVFNRQLGLPQAVSELCHSSQIGCDRRQAQDARSYPLGRIAIAIAAALALSVGLPGAAWATTYTGAAGAAGASGTQRDSTTWGIGGAGGAAATQAGTTPASGGAGGGAFAPGSQGTAGSGGGGGGGNWTASSLERGGSGGAASLGWAAGGAGGTGGAGGGGGGGGGGGYAGIFLPSSPAVQTSGDTYIGGAGGAGGSASGGNSTASGGGGGFGGAGVAGSGFSLTLSSGADATGGNGGAGGSSGGSGAVGGVGGVGGRGGDGGNGVSGSNISLTNQAIITGGNGGNGGGAGGPGGAIGGQGGQGGAGVAGSALTVVNTGSITGGNGGLGGAANSGTGGAAGVGGAGIAASGFSLITNAGTITGGFANGGAGAQAAAVNFTGGGNVLTLEAGSVLNGNAVSAGGDSLVLGGTLDSSFDVSHVVPTLSGSVAGTQYVGFSSLQKSGASTWTVVGNNGSGLGWVLNAGVLAVSSTNGAELGPSVTFNGGTLNFANSTAATYAGELIVGNSGGTLNADGGNATNFANNEVAFTGAIAGSGQLVVNADPAASNGFVVFNASGGTQSVATLTANNGIVQVGDGNTAATLSVGDLNVNGMTELSVARRAVLTVNGAINAAPTSTFAVNGELDVTTSTAVNTQVGFNGAGTLSVGAGATLNLQQGFYGEGLMRVTGSGTLLDTGNSSNLIGMTIDPGATFQIGNGGASDAISLSSFGGPFGGMTDNGTLVWNHSDAVTVSWPITGSGALIHAGSGTLTLDQINSYTGGSWVNGGTLAVDSNGGLGTGALVIAVGAQASFANATQQIASLNGAGALQLNGTALQIMDTGTSAFAGAIGGNGSLSFNGSGSLLLDGNSSAYTGSTTVASGTLVVGSVAGNGATLGGNVTVDSGATLRGHGSIGGSVDVLGGAYLAPGHSIGTLSISGDLNLAQGSVLNVDYAAPGANFQTAGAGDSVNVGGNLALNGATLNVNDVGGMGPGLYNVFTYSGTLTESHGGLILGSMPAGQTLQLQTLTTQKQINLIDTTGLSVSFWNANGLASAARMGGGSGSWSSSAEQWTDATGSVPNVMLQPQPGFAVFGGSAGTVTVDDSAGAVQANGLQFASSGYVLGGGTLALVSGNGSAPVIRVGNGSSASAGMVAAINNVLAGSAGLSKTDAGTLVLAGNNTYTGGTAIDGGTVSVAADANLGAASGGLSFNGGTLENTAAFTTSRSITLTGNGSLQTDANLTAAGTISGGGALAKTGAGRLTLIGANTYTGGTTISAGSVSVAADANLGAVSGSLNFNGGTLENSAAFSTARAITLAGNGSLQTDANLTLSGAIGGAGALTKTGTGTLVLAGTGTYTGGTLVNAGTLQGTTQSLQGSIVDNATLAFVQGTDGVFNGTLSGNGQLNVQGGVVVIDGVNAFAGHTTVSAGTLDVGDDTHAAATLNGLVSVNADGALHGIGTIGGLDLAGIIAPGNSIGTLHVAGNAVFEPGSSYQLEVQPNGSSDQIAVSGKASILGGKVAVLAQAGQWGLGSAYTVLTANQGVSGRFDGVSSNLAFLTPALSYTANAVNLFLARNDIALSSFASTRNQRAVAGGIQGMAYGQAVYDALMSMDAAQVHASYDPLSGELHASTRTALLDDSYDVRDAINRHLQGQDEADAATRPATHGEVTAWTSAWGHVGQLDGDGNAAQLNVDSSGLLVGADVPVDGQATVGAFGGTGVESARIAARGDHAHVHATHLGVYAATQWDALRLRGGLAYAWQQIDATREVGPAGGGAVNAHYDADLAHGYVEGGYRLQFGRAALEPYVNVARMQLRTDTIHEAGSAAALNVAGETSGTTAATLGARVYATLDPQGAARAYAGAGWRHAWGAVTPSIQAQFASGGSAFTVEGVPLATSQASVEAGLSWHFTPRVVMDASYQGQYASHAKDQAVRLSLSVAF